MRLGYGFRRDRASKTRHDKCAISAVHRCVRRNPEDNPMRTCEEVELCILLHANALLEYLPYVAV